MRILSTRELCTYCGRSPNHSQESARGKDYLDTTVKEEIVCLTKYVVNYNSRINTNILKLCIND